jgi:hypothetical protein
MSVDGHPDWSINLQSGETSVETPAGPATASQTPPQTPESAAAPPAGSTPPPTPEPTAPTPPQGEGFIPKYRFDEVNNRASEWQRENQELKDLLRQALETRSAGAAPAALAPPKSEEELAFDQQTQQIRDEFFRRFPKFAAMEAKWDELQARLDAIGPVADIVPQMQERETRHWATVAQTTLDELHREVSTTLLAGSPLDPQSPRGQQVSRAFFEWTKSDPTRVARYEANDKALLKDFVQYFGDAYVAPWRSSAPPSPPAPDPARVAAARVSRLPVSGPSALPAPQTPASRTNRDEESVHADAWAFVRNQAAAQTP